MGSGASSGMAEALEKATPAELNDVLKSLSEDQLKKVKEAVKGAAPKMKGKVTIHNVFKVLPADEETWDTLWKEHEVWMRKTHQIVGVTPANDGPKLLEYAIIKGKEMKDPMDPSSGETGKILYIMVEVYEQPEGIAQHMEFALGDDPDKNWPGFKKLVELANADNVDWPISQAGNCTILACMSDDAPAFQPKAGQSTITMCFKVPKDKEADLDAFWASHEKFMRSTHSTTEDGEEPRLVTYYVAKGNPPVDSLDPTKGVDTENLWYIMSECYFAPEGIGKHMAVAGEKWADDLAKLQEHMKNYTMYVQNNCTVFTSMTG